MKDAFYGILIVVFLLMIWAIQKNPKSELEPRHSGAVIIEKGDDFVNGYYMYLKYPKDSIKLERVYQIFYDKYSVGDTIVYWR
ncbi:MAG: hypothetical protein RLY43_554 [Bacteroidota bacterium]|jgi:hypothetical protein